MGSLISAPPLVLTRIETPLGDMVAVTDDVALHLFEFHDRTALPDRDAPDRDALRRRRRGHHRGQRRAGARAGRVLRRHADDLQRPHRPARLAVHGQVWAALREIPCGETRSYSQIADRIGRPSAVRAVARANGANQVAILVPCHRVIGADGTLVGYGGKLWRKQWLLDHERRLDRLF